MFSLSATLQEAPSLHPHGLSTRKGHKNTQSPEDRRTNAEQAQIQSTGNADSSGPGKVSIGVAPHNTHLMAKASWVFKDSSGS